jgi:hypothetical protein
VEEAGFDEERDVGLHGQSGVKNYAFTIIQLLPIRNVSPMTDLCTQFFSGDLSHRMSPKIHRLHNLPKRTSTSLHGNQMAATLRTAKKWLDLKQHGPQQ